MLTCDTRRTREGPYIVKCRNIVAKQPRLSLDWKSCIKDAFITMTI